MYVCMYSQRINFLYMHEISLKQKKVIKFLIRRRETSCLKLRTGERIFTCSFFSHFLSCKCIMFGNLILKSKTINHQKIKISSR